MMPPPRRYSAAPTLTCPHRNKSHSSHSSSSLQHTYSIDSSESMITVIPAAGIRLNNASGCSQPADPGEARSSRGSLCSGQQQQPIVGGEVSPLFSGGAGGSLARTPLSPRSPNRLGGYSPLGLLTPSTSEPPTPFSPANTLTSAGTSSTTGGLANTIVERKLLETTNTESASSSYYFNLNLQADKLTMNNDGFVDEAAGRHETMSSTMVENGTSYSSSRNDGFCAELNSDFDLEADRLDTEGRQLTRGANQRTTPRARSHQQRQQMPDDDLEPADEDHEPEMDPSLPLICATINDLCARHSREELEFLIGRIEWLTIRDCYYSEKSSTLCMVIEVQGK